MLKLYSGKQSQFYCLGSELAIISSSLPQSPYFNIEPAPMLPYSPQPAPSKQLFLQSMLSAFEQFQYTRSPEVLKSYMKKNRMLLISLFEQMESGTGETRALDSYQLPTNQKDKELNQRLERQYAEEMAIAKGLNMRESQIRAHSKLQEMEATLVRLNQQIGTVSEENKAMSAKLERQPFYKQWLVMQKEYEGAEALNGRLRAELEKKRLQIQEEMRKQSGNPPTNRTQN